MTSETTARVVGVAGALVGLCLVVASGLGVNALAHHHLAAGGGVLAAVLLLRWCSTALSDRWIETAATHRRSTARRSLVSGLLLPRSERARSHAALLSAVEADAAMPSLEVLKASAGTSVLAMVLIFWGGGWLAVGIVLVLLAGSAPLYQRAGKRAEVLEREYRERRAQLSARQLELLYHAPELQGLDAVAYGADEIAALSDSEHRLALRALRVALGSSLVTEFLAGVSVGLVAMTVGLGLLHGHECLSHALIAVLATSELFGHVRRYGVAFHRRQEALEAGELLREQPVAPLVNVPGAGVVLESVDLVTFANAAPVTVTVRLGERWCVSGVSGSGKTTLAATWLGWHPPVAGVVRRTATPVAYVGVTSELQSASLRENLCLERSFTDDEVRHVLGAVGLDTERFADLDLRLTGDGQGLSTGERCRLLIARAILHDVDLLILDDLSGVLDAETRATVHRALAPRTCAIIELTPDTATLIDPTLTVELH